MSSDPIIVFGPWVGTEADAMAEVLDGFDAEVRYIGSGDFVADLNGWLAVRCRPPRVLRSFRSRR